MARERGHGVISVLIAAAASRTRACLTRQLEAAEGIAVLGEAATGERALALAHELGPDVVLLEAERRGTALAATPHLLRSLKLRAWHHGLSGLVDRGVTPEELVWAVEMSASGVAFFMPSNPRRDDGGVRSPRSCEV